MEYTILISITVSAVTPTNTASPISNTFLQKWFLLISWTEEIAAVSQLVNIEVFLMRKRQMDTN